MNTYSRKKITVDKTGVDIIIAEKTEVDEIGCYHSL